MSVRRDNLHSHFVCILDLIHIGSQSSLIIYTVQPWFLSLWFGFVDSIYSSNEFILTFQFRLPFSSDEFDDPEIC